MLTELGNGLGPQGISAAVSAGAVLAGTVLGGLLLALGQIACRGGRPQPLIIAGTALSGSLVGLVVFTLAWWLLDNTAKPVNSPPLLMAAVCAGLLSLFNTVNKLDVQAKLAPLAWLPYGIGLIIIFVGTGLAINEWREQSGFYRGFERIHSYNMIRPLDAMSTPTRAVQHYNQQFNLLRTANQDRGWGNILQTQSRFDALWFLSNDQWINEHFSRRDPIGLGRVVQDPRAIRVMALSQLARPVFGEIVEERILGDEALVRTDEGQIVRLLREGPHWKIYGWLGHRFAMMEEIFPTKQEKEGLTAEDKDEAESAWQRYELEVEQLAMRAGMPWRPSSDFANMTTDEAEGEARPVARGGMIRRRSRTGFARLDLAPPGVLIDLTNDARVEWIEVPAPGPRGQLAQARAQQDTPVVPMPPTPDAAAIPPTPAPGPLPRTPVPTPQPEAIPTTPPSEAPVATPVANEAQLPSETQPTGASILEQAQAVTTPPPSPALLALPPPPPVEIPVGTPLITGLFAGPTLNPNELIEFWPKYFEAVEGVMRNDIRSVRMFMALMAPEDRQWFQGNARLMCILLTPDALNWPEERAQLVASQMLLRNMPTRTIPPERIRSWQNTATAVSRLVDRTPEGDRIFTTLLREERGQWYLVHPFWARTFIWTPQIAPIKQSLNLPLSLDEVSYLQSGVSPMQAYIRQVYTMLGFQP